MRLAEGGGGSIEAQADGTRQGGGGAYHSGTSLNKGHKACGNGGGIVDTSAREGVKA